MRLPLYDFTASTATGWHPGIELRALPLLDFRTTIQIATSGASVCMWRRLDWFSQCCLVVAGIPKCCLCQFIAQTIVFIVLRGFYVWALQPWGVPCDRHGVRRMCGPQKQALFPFPFGNLELEAGDFTDEEIDAQKGNHGHFP